MELRIDYSSNVPGQEKLAVAVADLAHELGHVCMLMPMLAEGEGDYPTMEMKIDGQFVLGSSSEIREAFNDGSLEQDFRENH